MLFHYVDHGCHAFLGCRTGLPLFYPTLLAVVDLLL